MSSNMHSPPTLAVPTSPLLSKQDKDTGSLHPMSQRTTAVLGNINHANIVFDLNAMSSVALQGYNNLDEVVNKVTESYTTLQQSSKMQEAAVTSSLPERTSIGVDVLLQREVLSVLHKLRRINPNLQQHLKDTDCEILAPYATITNLSPGEYHVRAGERHYSAGFVVAGELSVETTQPLAFEKKAIEMIKNKLKKISKRVSNASNPASSAPSSTSPFAATTTLTSGPFAAVANATSENASLAPPSCPEDSPLVRRLHFGSVIGALSLFHGMRSRACYYAREQLLPEVSSYSSPTEMLTTQGKLTMTSSQPQLMGVGSPRQEESSGSEVPGSVVDDKTNMSKTNMSSSYLITQSSGSSLTPHPLLRTTSTGGSLLGTGSHSPLPPMSQEQQTDTTNGNIVATPTTNVTVDTRIADNNAVDTHITHSRTFTNLPPENAIMGLPTEHTSPNLLLFALDALQSLAQLSPAVYERLMKAFAAEAEAEIVAEGKRRAAVVKNTGLGMDAGGAGNTNGADVGIGTGTSSGMSESLVDDCDWDWAIEEEEDEDDGADTLTSLDAVADAVSASIFTSKEQLSLDQFASYALTVTPYQKNMGMGPNGMGAGAGTGISLASPSQSTLVGRHNAPISSPSGKSLSRPVTRYGGYNGSKMDQNTYTSQEYDSNLCYGEWQALKGYLVRVRNGTEQIPVPQCGVPVFIGTSSIECARDVQQWLKDDEEGRLYCLTLEQALATGKSRYGSVFGFQDTSKHTFGGAFPSTVAATPLASTTNSSLGAGAGVGGGTGIYMEMIAKGVPLSLAACLSPTSRTSLASAPLSPPHTQLLTALFPPATPSPRLTAHIARAAYRFVVALLARRCSAAESGLRLSSAYTTLRDSENGMLLQKIESLEREIAETRAKEADRQREAAMDAVQRAKDVLWRGKDARTRTRARTRTCTGTGASSGSDSGKVAARSGTAFALASARTGTGVGNSEEEKADHDDEQEEEEEEDSDSAADAFALRGLFFSNLTKPTHTSTPAATATAATSAAAGGGNAEGNGVSDGAGDDDDGDGNSNGFATRGIMFGARNTGNNTNTNAGVQASAEGSGSAIAGARSALSLQDILAALDADTRSNVTARAATGLSTATGATDIAAADTPTTATATAAAVTDGNTNASATTSTIITATTTADCADATAPASETTEAANPARPTSTPLSTAASTTSTSTGADAATGADAHVAAATAPSSPFSSLSYQEKLALLDPQQAMSTRLTTVRRALLALDTLARSSEAAKDTAFASQIAAFSHQLAEEASSLERGIAKMMLREREHDVKRLLRIVAAVCGKGLIDRTRMSRDLMHMHCEFAKSAAETAEVLAGLAAGSASAVPATGYAVTGTAISTGMGMGGKDRESGKMEEEKEESRIIPRSIIANGDNANSGSGNLTSPRRSGIIRPKPPSGTAKAPSTMKSPRPAPRNKPSSENNPESSQTDQNSGKTLPGASALSSLPASADVSPSSMVSATDAVAALKERGRLNLLAAAARALSNSVGAASRGEDIYTIHEYSNNNNGKMSGTSAVVGTGMGVDVSVSDLDTSTTSLPLPHPSAHTYSITTPTASDGQCYMCIIRDADGNITQQCEVPRAWDQPSDDVHDVEGSAALSTVQLYENVLTLALPDGHTRTIEVCERKDPMRVAGCLRYWLGVAGDGADSSEAAAAAIAGDAEAYWQRIMDKEKGSGNDGNSGGSGDVTDTTPAASDGGDGHDVAIATATAATGTSTVTSDDVTSTSPSSFHTHGGQRSAALMNLLSAQAHVSRTVYTEALHVLQNWRERSRELSVCVREEREMRACLERDGLQREQEELVKARREIQQVQRERDEARKEKEECAVAAEHTQARLYREREEEKEEWQRKLRVLNETVRRARAEAEKAREEETRTRDRVVNVERKRQADTEAYRAASKRLEQVEQEISVKKEENNELKSKIQSLQDQLLQLSRGGGHGGAYIDAEEEEAMVRRRSALEEESRALAKRAQAQRKQAIEAREHLAVLASKERDLMAAIDALRATHSQLMAQHAQNRVYVPSQGTYAHGTCSAGATAPAGTGTGASAGTGVGMGGGSGSHLRGMGMGAGAVAGGGYRSREGSAARRIGLPGAGSAIVGGGSRSGSGGVAGSGAAALPYQHFLPPLNTQ